MKTRAALPLSLASFARILAFVLGAGVAGVQSGCDAREDPPKSPETIAVEEKAGDFLDYYANVLRLSHEYSAHPDSFRAALEELPGSHLSEEEWMAWTAPYRNDPREVSERLEKIIAGLKARP
jgi:hypothetical protein